MHTFPAFFLPYLWHVLFSFFKLFLLRITRLLTFEISLLVLYYMKFYCNISSKYSCVFCVLFGLKVQWARARVCVCVSVFECVCVCVCECVWVWVRICELTETLESKVLCVYLKFIKSPPSPQGGRDWNKQKYIGTLKYKLDFYFI